MWYTGINIIINLIGFCIFKSYVISEKRTTPYNIVKLLKYELFILCTYLKKIKKFYWFYYTIQEKIIGNTIVKVTFIQH